MTAPIDLTRCSTVQLQALVDSARQTVQQQRLLRPQVAIVLGSGLSGLAERIAHAQAIDYEQIPGFCRTQVSGHAGQLITGYFGGLPVVLMQGRYHRYEGWSTRQVQFPIRVMQALGATTLITTNAAGGLNPRFEVGDLMVIDSHIDLLWPRGQWASPEPRPGKRAGAPYDRALIRRMHHIALTRDMILRQGCYLGTLGPTYETRSEYRFFRWAGADAAGMSTIPEVLVARDLGMQVLGVSVITNVASTDTPSQTSHAEVDQEGRQAGPRLMGIVEQLLEEISGQPD